MSSAMDIIDEFTEENGIADLTLLVEDHKIPVSKSVLCIASPVFRTMLEGNFSERNKKEIPLPGKKYRDFVEFLRCIYPNKTKKVTENTVYTILPLAQKYDVKNVVSQCQNVLLQIVKNKYRNHVKQLVRHINLSEKHILEDLKDKCIYLASEHTLKKIKAAKDKHDITDTSYCKIIEIALRRHELDRGDESALEAENDDSGDEIAFEVKGKIDTESKNTGDILRALRLTNRFEFSLDNRDFESELLNKLKELPDKDEYTEEIDLLPDDMKSTLYKKKK